MSASAAERVALDTTMTGFRGANGGYLMAVALRSMLAAIGEAERVPRTLSTHLLAPVTTDAVDVRVAVERAGGSMSTASARLEQNGVPAALLLGAFGRGGDSIARHDVAMPDVPAPEDCAPLIEKPVPQAGTGLAVEHRPAAPPLPLTGSGRAEILVWMRLADDRPVDTVDATFLADCGPPGLYGALDAYVAMPSTDITLRGT